MQWRKKKIILSFFIIAIVIILSIKISSKSYPLNTIADISQHPIYQVDRKDKVIALTFDINWAEKDNIYSILGTLDKYNIKGTFFIIGSWVTYSDENVEKLKAIYEGGNEIGNHSFKHSDFTNLSENEIKVELEKTDEVIKKYTGDKTKIFRFPSGAYNDRCNRIVNELGYRTVQWNVDSIDWKEAGEEIEYERVIENVKPGSIILFHNNTKYTPNNLEKIIKKLSKDGYKFKTISGIIYDKHDSYVDNEGILRKNN